MAGREQSEMKERTTKGEKGIKKNKENDKVKNREEEKQIKEKEMGPKVKC